ncbi:hypothetical protein FA13DRAFT_166394 [Coprinellus micaceus]|uniref:Uncharacterized protein n=1 Tax=Coprinellus micaceus TaxID=71717 RepID=A0A4Y7SIR1_COPMI|nr:hypothetical protein FA13DRAFT_166394 [Coprinellus micaceus]
MQLGCAEGDVDSALSLSARFMSFKRRRNEKKERLRAPAQKEDEARGRKPSKRFTSRVLYIHPVISGQSRTAFVFRPLHGSNAVHYAVIGKAGLNFGGRRAIATGGSPGRSLDVTPSPVHALTCTPLRSSFGGGEVEFEILSVHSYTVGSRMMVGTRQPSAMGAKFNSGSCRQLQMV